MNEQKATRKANKVAIRDRAQKIRPRQEFWEDEAKCKGGDPNLFVYPSDFPTEKQRKQLEAICSSCKVILDCRLEGLRTMSDGWWGGMTPEERYRWAREELFNEE